MSGICTPKMRKASTQPWPGVAIDEEANQLSPNRIFARRSPVGYVCVGLGDPTRLLRFAFEDENYETNPIFAAACQRLGKAVEAGGVEKARRLGLKIPLGCIDDPALRRLAIASALLKAGFNPAERRDDDGLWTDGGASGTTSTLGTVVGSVAAADTIAGSVFGSVSEATLAALGILGSGMLAATAFLGVLFFPTNRSQLSAGTLPGHPDLSYRYDDGEGSLSLFQNGERIFFAHPDADGVFRDSDGRIVGRKLDGSVMLDPDAAAGLASSAAPAQRPGDDPDAVGAAVGAATGAIAGAEIGSRLQTGAADATRNEPKLCPDPGPDKPGGKSEEAVAYQAFISRLVNPDNPLPPGLAVKLWNSQDERDVFFDDCRHSDGTMIEAKGPGYLEMLEKGTFFPWQGVEWKILDQADRQVEAAGPRTVVWYFAEEKVADYVRALFLKEKIEITVRYAPMP